MEKNIDLLYIEVVMKEKYSLKVDMIQDKKK